MSNLTYEGLVDHYGEPLAWQYLKEIETAARISTQPDEIVDPEIRLAAAIRAQDAMQPSFSIAAG